MALELTQWLRGDPWILVAAVALDLALGDPEYRWHPVRLVGRSLSAMERTLRRAGADGYGGGILLGLSLATLWTGLLSALVVAGHLLSPWLGSALHLFILYSLLALGDLLQHVWAVERPLAGGDVAAARVAIARLVGRDTAPMNAAACRRAAVESLGENLTDGFISPLFWYAIGGVPALVLFKVASTMDSMVGYKTPTYLRFGWFGARLDDAMNYVPARLTWLLIGVCSVVVPGCSAIKAWRIGWRQHRVLLGPNSGWSEAATAGAIQRRIVGPIWLQGQMVTDRWIGESSDPPLDSRSDLVRALRLVTVVGLAAVAVVVVLLTQV
ncbi:MAG: adenosylcobinamide-phosphate synthase CbiB [Vicinamibacterales bacterium]